MGLTSPGLVYATLAVAAVAFAGGYSLRDTQAKAHEAEVLKAARTEQLRMQTAVDQASAKYEDAIALARVAVEARGSRIRELYRNVPATADDCLPPPALRGLLDGAVLDANAAASGQSGKPVPPASSSPATP